MTYTVEGQCYNCGHVQGIEVPKGTHAPCYSPYACVACGCKDTVKSRAKLLVTPGEAVEP